MGTMHDHSHSIRQCVQIGQWLPVHGPYHSCRRHDESMAGHWQGYNMDADFAEFELQELKVEQQVPVNKQDLQVISSPVNLWQMGCFPILL